MRPLAALSALVVRQDGEIRLRLVAQRLIVETDGPHHRTPQQLADDARAKAHAARHGFRMLRVPEEGFEHRQDRVERQIWAALEAD